MNLPKRKLILILVFILVCVSLLRVLKITISTSYLATLEHDSKTKNPIGSKYGNKILTEKELRFLSDIILQKSPCNLLIFGLEDQYIMLSAINKGGKTVFLDDKPEKLIKIDNETKVFRIMYKTSAKEAYRLLKHKIALMGFPKEVIKTKWDVIVVDGPESPGRMGAIYMAGALARAGNGTNVVVHDVFRTIENWLSWEFISEKNLVSSKGRFWNFRIAHKKNLVSLKKLEPLKEG